jgi:1,4-dihydroxy-2-naphthoate octaprenyltransferase
MFEVSDQKRALIGTSERPSALRIWWLAIRPHTLTISMAPVVVGVALARLETGGIRWDAFLIALIGAVLIQIGTNLYNDAGDFLKGGDRADRVGPRRVTAAGWLTPGQVQGGAFVAFGLAAWAGIYLIWLGGWPILWIGLASILAGLAYSAGPKPIAYTALGEVFVFLFFGLVAVLGTYYLQTDRLSSGAALAATMIGLHAAAVLTVNNYRDMEADAAVGRVTLAHRLGIFGTRILYTVLILLPFLLLLPLVTVSAGLWLPALLLPLALLLCRQFWVLDRDEAQNVLLIGTARLQLAFALLVTIGALGGARAAMGSG